MRSRGVQARLAVLVVGILAGTAGAARADDLACISASENEVGLRKQLHLRDAMKQLSVCADPACPHEVQVECARRLAALTAALPTIVFAVTDAAGDDVAAVNVTVDGAAFASSLDGRALPIDPGSHVVRFEAPGKPAVEKTIIVREGEKDRRLKIVLGAPARDAAPTPAATLPVATPATPAATAPAPEALRSSSSWSMGKSLAVAAGGVGVAGLAVGTVFGLMASSDASTQRADCSATTGCSNRAGALSAHSSSLSAGNVSTAMFLVGGAGVVGGVLLWLTAPKGGGGEVAPAPASAPRAYRFDPLVGPGGGGVMMSGSFQ